MAPETMSRAMIRRGRLWLIFLPPARRKISRNKEPMAPLIKDRRDEERGIYLRKTPIVPKISIEEASISIDRGELFPLSFSVDV
jgi:hypothetical protein